MKFSDTALLITNLKAHNHFPEIMPVLVSNLIKDSVDEFKRHNINSSMQIQNNVEDNNALIKVDSDLLRTCFLMIIENSAKFAGNNATLTISTTLIYNSISIIFTDNGPGFSNEALDNLFELFSAGDLLHTEGTGLGLATSKLILDTHEGTINVNNIKEGGAQVIIKIKHSEK